MKHAHKIFTEALSGGEDKLDALHQKYCQTPPVPLKENNLNNRNSQKQTFREYPGQETSKTNISEVDSERPVIYEQRIN